MKKNKESFTEKFLNLSKKYEGTTFNWQAPVVWDHARGAEIWDVDGNHYIDWTSGVLVTNVGHAHPKLAAAISRQSERLLNTFDFPTPERLSLAQKIVDLFPEHLDKVFFATTGSEAIDIAMRIAKRFTRKYEILSFWGGFHGRSFGPMSLSGIGKIKHGFGPSLPGAIFAPYPYCYRCPFQKEPQDCNFLCVNVLDTIVDSQSTGNLAALIIEPYQGTAGFIFPPVGYLKMVEDWAKKRDLVFILDEIQSSYGRTGKMWALEHENLRPNIVTLGKGMGSGVPISAIVTENRILAALQTGELSSTLGGNPLCCAGALAVLEIMKEEKLAEKAEKTGAYLKEKLFKLKDKYEIIGDVRGIGLVYGIEFVKDRQSKEPMPDVTKEIVLKCVRSGLMVGKLGIYGNVMRVAPPLIIEMELIDKSVDILDKILSEI